MKKAEVEIGGRYLARVSGSIEQIRITSPSQYGGWYAVNLRTGRTVRVKTAARLRRRIDEPVPVTSQLLGPAGPVRDAVEKMLRDEAARDNP